MASSSATRCRRWTRRSGEFTEEAGTTRWYLYDLDREAILEEPQEIVAQHPLEPGDAAEVHDRGEDPHRAPREGREAHQEHATSSASTRPLGVKPALKCWMELNEG